MDTTPFPMIFLSFVKYPPSFSFILFFLGINLMLMGIFGGVGVGKKRRWEVPNREHQIITIIFDKCSQYFNIIIVNPLLYLGRSPLFFYCAHWGIYGLFALIMWAIKGFDFSYGLGLSPLFYFLWFIGVIILILPCKYYGEFKLSKPPESIWRIF